MKQSIERGESLLDLTATLDFSLEDVLSDLEKLLVATVEKRPEFKAHYPKGREFFINYLKDPVDNLRQLSRRYTRAQA